MSKYLDTRDLYKRQQELEDLKNTVESARDDLKEAQEALAACDSDNPDDDEWYEKRDTAQAAVDAAAIDFGDDEQAELAELDELENEIGREWRHGETMIPENDFEDYARQLADELGVIPDETRWPCTCIDWEQAAKELAMDYTTVTYQGDDYYVRA